ncbi:MAG: carbohydrate-binding family 9-like protein [Bryobacteraceae bacterium]|nr:carbohydrate-binding family 9-like protein [Bryobacteraceae bacterium]
MPDDVLWEASPRSPRFVDMVTGAPGLFDTRAAALWDDEALYVKFWVEEPFVEARQTERDSLVFLENDVEVFIDGGDCYYEFEINAAGTVYEVFFIWHDAYAKFDHVDFDVRRRRALTFGGDYDRTGAHFWRGTHPRGLRWAFLDWDFPGMRWSVRVDGTLNDASDIDRGWTAQVVFPWSGMRPLANGRSLPPRPGDRWRIFFGRFQKLVLSGIEVQPHPAWAWSAHGVYDTHQPEKWTEVEFVADAV